MDSNKIKTDTGQMIIRNVPEALRREFKALCAREGKSIQKKIIELMKSAVKKEDI